MEYDFIIFHHSHFQSDSLELDSLSDPDSEYARCYCLCWAASCNFKNDSGMLAVQASASILRKAALLVALYLASKSASAFLRAAAFAAASASAASLAYFC